MKTKYIFHIKAYLLCSILMLGVWNCKNKGKDKTAQVIEQPQLEDSLFIQSSNIEYLLPSPNEILNIIFKEKFNYNPALAIKPNVDADVINSNIQALILGVYISDFTYSLLFNDINRCTKYLATIKTLSEKSKLNGVFDEAFFKRIEGNVGNIDSLNEIYSDFSKNSFYLITSSGNKELLSIIAMGASIESIYLGYNVLKTESIDKSLKPFFVEQRVVFENFYQNYLNYNIKKKDIKQFNNDLITFYSHFKLNIWLIADKNKVLKTDTDTTIDVKYIVKTNSDNFNDLGKSICTLRNNLINHSYQ